MANQGVYWGVPKAVVLRFLCSSTPPPPWCWRPFYPPLSSPSLPPNGSDFFVVVNPPTSSCGVTPAIARVGSPNTIWPGFEGLSLLPHIFHLSLVVWGTWLVTVTLHSSPHSLPQRRLWLPTTDSGGKVRSPVRVNPATETRSCVYSCCRGSPPLAGPKIPSP